MKYYRNGYAGVPVCFLSKNKLYRLVQYSCTIDAKCRNHTVLYENHLKMLEGLSNIAR